MSRTYEQLEPVISALDDRIKTNLGAFPTDTAEGSTASFADGADGLPLKSLIVNIDPVQDLHGQDAPWPAGGGTNKAVPKDVTTTVKGVTVVASASNETITLSGTATDSGGRNDKLSEIFTLPAGTYYFNVYGSTAQFALNGSDGTLIKWEGQSFTLEAETNVYFGVSVISGTTYNETIKVSITEGSTTPTAWTPYSNICPISGWTGANVTMCGKNLLDPSLLKDQVSWNIIPVYAPAGTVLTMSTNQPTVSTSGLLTYFMTPGGAQGSTEVVSAGHPVTQTVGEDGYLNVAQRNRDSIKSYADYDYQIEVGSTATPYEPYQGQTIPISWQTEAGTVYGGSLDVLSGVLTVDRAMVDLGTLTWTLAGTSRFYAAFTPIAKVATNATERIQGFICSCYPFSTNTGYADTMDDKSMLRGGNTAAQIMIRDTSYTDATAFKTAMDGVQLVYELATPIEIQLTPHEVRSLLGKNNIFADTGDTEVEYRADTKLYIERLTEPDADMIADANIVSGQYFMVGNKLYLATANIASGSAVIVGTNATRKSLSEALNEINS